MGMFAAVGSVYANMFNFSGRARRAEYWWFQLFAIFMAIALQAGAYFWLSMQPEVGLALYGLINVTTDPELSKLLGEQAARGFWLDHGELLMRWAGILFVVYLFALWIPQLAVTVRRLHDTGRSGWWMFKPLLISIVGGIVLGFLAGLAGAASGTPSPALMLMAMTLPLATSIWYLVVLCLPGTHGTNRFGPDPIPNRPPREAGHPALVKEMDEELGRMVADRRKEEFQDYYRARVLPAIERTKAARRV